MAARDARISPDPAKRAPTFELERFAWGAPDRLDLSGRFVGLTAPAGPPALVVQGAKGTHRLPGTSRPPGPPKDGRRWRAEFAWREVPEAFDTAQLQLGDELTVDLPAPADESARRSLPVQQAPSTPASEGPTPAGADRVRLEAELLAVREEAGELRARAERAAEELMRARADLEAEHDRRTADAARFRDGLAGVRRSAEAALAETEEALRARESAVAELRDERDAAVAARSAAEAAAEAARAESERLAARLATVRDALGDGG